jgi:ABC-type dipeptide/oligopeptide/nickel transport system ATPase subunit
VYPRGTDGIGVISSAIPILQARGVSVRFGVSSDAFYAVQDVSVCALPGQVVGVVGESGSGKTTLARVLVGLQRPSAGQVELEGKPIIGDGYGYSFPRRERWKVQMVFQDPYSCLNPRQRAWQAVAEAIRVWQKASASDAKLAALSLLKRMGITDEQANHFPASLSGGQRQRVSIARALAPRPKILIADEPTSSIDQSAQAQLLNLLRQLRKEDGLSLIFISHNLGLVHYLSSYVYVMQRGEIVEAGDTPSVFTNPRHPYTQRLMRSSSAQDPVVFTSQ